MPATILQPRQAFAPLMKWNLANRPCAMPQSHNTASAPRIAAKLWIRVRSGPRRILTKMGAPLASDAIEGEGLWQW
jgi:hypothetical protein